VRGFAEMAEDHKNSMAAISGAGGRSAFQNTPPGQSLQLVSDLEKENQRLQRLVAELLIKNQELRAEIKSRGDWPSGDWLTLV
jgi:hypothetical protein